MRVLCVPCVVCVCVGRRGGSGDGVPGTSTHPPHTQHTNALNQRTNKHTRTHTRRGTHTGPIPDDFQKLGLFNGTLRITASLSFAMHHVAPLLREYTERYPNVQVHVEAANRYMDIIDNNIDVAIRTREFEPDSNITIRRVAETRRLMAASPAYLAAHGVPKSLEDLQQHKLLIYTFANNPNELRFTREGEVRVVNVAGLLESNDGQILRAAALDGMGILVQPTYILYEDIVAGRLVPVLDDWDLPRLNVNLAYPSRKHLSAKVRTFIDFMVEHFDRMDYERKWTSRFDGA